jgi:hypothetical protein
MDEIIGRVIEGVAAGLILVLLSLFFKSVRDTLLYRRVEYDLDYEKGMGQANWDIQWEGYRLTILVADVSNDYIEGA